MKFTLLIFLLAFTLPSEGSPNLATISRESRELRMAEDAILTSLIVSSNSSSRYICSQDPYACIGADKSEIALALIAARNSSESLNALGNVLRFRIDGELSEDFECYALDKGEKMVFF